MKVVCSSNEHVNSGDVVLVRNELDEIWTISHFSHTDNDNYICTNNTSWKYCIPLAKNEHLCGTSKNHKIKFPEFGSMVKGTRNNSKKAIVGILAGYIPSAEHPYRVIFKINYSNKHMGYTYDFRQCDNVEFLD